MKTNWIAFKKGGLLPMIMAALLALITMNCDKVDDPIYDEYQAPEELYNGNILTETFWVNPDGSRIVLFHGDVSLEFPEGAVMVPTQFTLASFPLHHLKLEGHNLYNRGYSLSGPTPNQKFMTSSIKIRIKYDLFDQNWLKSVPTDPDNLTILNVSPFVYAYDRVVSIGECCTDFSYKIITGCICQCGFYVVGEN